MTIFTIPGDETRYKYPETTADVTLGQYLSFVTDVLTQEPKEVQQLSALTSRIFELETDLQPWIKKGVPDALMMTREEVAKALVAYANNPQSPKKTRQILPPMASEYLSKIEEQAALSAAMGNLWYAKGMLPYMAKVVAHFTGVSLDRITGRSGPGMERRAVELLYNKIMKACTPPEEYSYQRTYVFEGQVYELPEKNMANSTVIEFAEAAQFQANVERLQNGHFLSLIDVISVLLRRPGEVYSEEVYDRNREAFTRLPLSIALDIAFFLMKRSEQSVLNFVTSTTIPAGEKGLQEVAQTLRSDTAGISHSRPLPRVVYSLAPTLRR